MRIVFDARMLGHGFGIGIYIRELLKRLVGTSRHEWLILVRSEMEEYAKKEFVGDRTNVRLILADIDHYSWKEQVLLPQIMKKLKPHLVHFPNFNVPVFFNGKYLVTIHDLVHHRLPRETVKRILHAPAYHLAVKSAVNKSKAIIAVSKSAKNEILSNYPETPDRKIYVIHEGVDQQFSTQELPGEIYMLREKYGIVQPYVLFVGVWEVKKNLPLLGQAFNKLAEKNPDLKLVLAGKEDPSHPEVRGEVMTAVGNYDDRVIAPGFIETEDLPALYRQAQAFVNPSPNEGFGLPGLEAMACGTPVVVAETEVFKEVYGDAALYFPAHSAQGAAEAVSSILVDEKVRSRQKARGLEQALRYTWEDTAQRTLKLYEELL